ERGYRMTDRTCVQTANLKDIPAPPIREDGALLHSSDRLYDAWMDAYALIEGSGKAKSEPRRQVLESIAPQHRFFWADFGMNTVAKGHGPPGLGLAVLERGWIGVFCMATREDFRRQGIATAILHSMAEWGLTHGADRAYLQVACENTPALAAYEHL